MKQTRIITIALLATAAIPAFAQSAEIQLLERERLEANRYYSQVEQQTNRLVALRNSAHTLAKRADKAYKTAVQREIAFKEMLNAEQGLADSRVSLAEYQQIEYVMDSSAKDVIARIK